MDARDMYEPKLARVDSKATKRSRWTRDELARRELPHPRATSTCGQRGASRGTLRLAAAPLARSAPFAPLALIALSSCAATRSLEIRSEPPGAEVSIDHNVIGRTPLVWEFFDYGTHDVTFHLDGYRSQARILTLEAPWQARFPIDVLSEVVVPVGWTDRHELFVKLEAGTAVMEQPDLRLVLERAAWLRTAGPGGPGPQLVLGAPVIQSVGSPEPSPRDSRPVSADGATLAPAQPLPPSPPADTPASGTKPSTTGTGTTDAGGDDTGPTDKEAAKPPSNGASGAAAHAMPPTPR